MRRVTRVLASILLLVVVTPTAATVSGASSTMSVSSHGKTKICADCW